MQPMIVTVGPLVAADADGISLSQTAPGAFGLAINGALSTGFSATSIAAAQAVSGAGDLTLNGSLVNAGVAYLGNGAYVAITSAGNHSGITYTVKGLYYGPNSEGGSYVSETVTGPNSSVVVTTKRFSTVSAITASGSATGNVSVGINGSVTLDEARRILFTSSADDSDITFTLTGTDWNNNPITQTFAGGASTTAVSTLDFGTITSIVCSGATSGTVTVGTNGVAGTRPLFFDPWAFAPWTMQSFASGTVNYTVQFSMDNPNDVGLANVNWVDSTDTNFVSATASKYGGFANTPRVMRMVLNSGSGSVRLTAIQNANVPL